MKEIPIELQNEPKEIQKALNQATKDAKEKFAAIANPPVPVPERKPESSDFKFNQSESNIDSIPTTNQFGIDTPSNIISRETKESQIIPKNDPIRGQMIDTINKTTVQNNDIRREQELGGQTQIQPIINTSISNSDNTSFMPIKPKPRADDNSALGRYQDRISMY